MFGERFILPSRLDPRIVARHHRPMNVVDLAVRLDSFFHVDRFASDDFEAIVEFCQEAGIPIAEYATQAFLHRFNGLMLHNAEEVRRVFTLVFPSGGGCGAQTIERLRTPARQAAPAGRRKTTWRRQHS